jgi:hypothetical protein
MFYLTKIFTLIFFLIISSKKRIRVVHLIEASDPLILIPQTVQRAGGICLIV